MFKPLAFTLFAALGLAGQARADGIEAHDAYVVSVGAMAQTAAVFMALHNHGTVDDLLLSVRSDAARVVQLHSSDMSADGVMTMAEITDPLPLPADGEIMLEHGGYHIMLMGLTAPLEQGDVVQLILTFQQAGDVVIDVTVDHGRTGDMDMDHD